MRIIVLVLKIFLFFSACLFYSVFDACCRFRFSRHFLVIVFVEFEFPLGLGFLLALVLFWMSSSSGAVSPSVSLGSFFELWQQAHSMEGVDLEDRAKVVEAFRTGVAARAGSWHRLRSECGLLGGFFSSIVEILIEFLRFLSSFLLLDAFRRGFCCAGGCLCNCAASLCGTLVAFGIGVGVFLLVMYHLSGDTVTEEEGTTTTSTPAMTVSVTPWVPRRGRFDRDWSSLNSSWLG